VHQGAVGGTLGLDSAAELGCGLTPPGAPAV
jgi:hypothetical protein